MGRSKDVLLTVTVALVGTPAMAAPPILDGTYIIESSTACQYEISAPTATMPDRVTSIFGSFKGQFEKGILTVTFDNATKRASGKGIIVRGDHVAFAGQSSQGVIEQNTTITNRAFSNTATTFKIGPDVFKVFYGSTIAGKVKNAVFVRKDVRCAESGTITLVEN